MDEGFCRPARQKIAGILNVFQDFLTRQGGKEPGQTAFNACEYRFSDHAEQRLQILTSVV